MKRLVLISTCILFLALIGCQPTPDMPVIVGKDSAALLEKAEVREEASAPINLAERLDIPITYSTELKSKGGQLTVYVDASVIVPSSEIPIIRVKPTDFSIQQIERFAKTLFGDDAKYVEQQLYTCGYYMRIIDKLRTAIDNWDTIGQYYYDMKYDSSAAAEDDLAVYIQKAAEAPATQQGINPNFSWRYYDPTSTTKKYMEIWAMPDDSTFEEVFVSCDNESGLTTLEYSFDSFISMSASRPLTKEGEDLLTITEEAARKVALSTVADLGMNDFICVGSEKIIYQNDPLKMYSVAGYDYIFTRQISGVDVTFTNDDATYDNGFQKMLFYEKLHVVVGNKGVLHVTYSSPYEIQETVMDKTTLLPFKQVMDVFSKMIVIVNNDADAGTWGASATRTYNITKIQLGLMTVFEQNSDCYLLIPVWDFIGYDTLSTASGTNTFNENMLQSYLTINAIDGSIIQRGLGS